MTGNSARKRCVAVDLGAESGRVVVGEFDGATVTTTIVHRFANLPRPVQGHLRWDLSALWTEVRTGLALAGEAGRVDAVGVDTWGIDYGYVGRDGEILADPVSHRDARTRGLVEAARSIVGDRLYTETGTQVLNINSVFQLMAETRAGERPEGAHRLLLVPDLFHHLLSGSDVAEHTVASTTGAYDVGRRRWATGLLEDLGIATDTLPEVVDAGTVLGPLLPGLSALPGLGRARVVAPGSHDTASAVAAVPLASPAAGYVSSGTWCLTGVERELPLLDDAARTANLTNEGGVDGTVRLLRNVTGLWILQECRRQWLREGLDLSYEEIARLAAGAPPLQFVVDVDHPSFLEPGDMPARIREYCRASAQPAPDGAGEVARAVLEGLALAYRRTFDDIGRVTGTSVTSVHVVGGGARNDLLNHATADATQLPVHAGPVEATALGNLLVQLEALGELDGLEDVRAVVTATEPARLVEPDPAAADRWQDAYERLLDLRARVPVEAAP